MKNFLRLFLAIYTKKKNNVTDFKFEICRISLFLKGFFFQNPTLFVLSNNHMSALIYSSNYLGKIIYLVRKDIDINKHERLSNLTLGHKIK